MNPAEPLNVQTFFCNYIFYPEQASGDETIIFGLMYERTAAYILTVGLGIITLCGLHIITGAAWGISGLIGRIKMADPDSEQKVTCLGNNLINHTNMSGNSKAKDFLKITNEKRDFFKALTEKKVLNDKDILFPLLDSFFCDKTMDDKHDCLVESLIDYLLNLDQPDQIVWNYLSKGRSDAFAIDVRICVCKELSYTKCSKLFSYLKKQDDAHCEGFFRFLDAWFNTIFMDNKYHYGHSEMTQFLIKFEAENGLSGSKTWGYLKGKQGKGALKESTESLLKDSNNGSAASFKPLWIYLHKQIMNDPDFKDFSIIKSTLHINEALEWALKDANEEAFKWLQSMTSPLNYICGKESNSLALFDLVTKNKLWLNELVQIQDKSFNKPFGGEPRQVSDLFDLIWKKNRNSYLFTGILHHHLSSESLFLNWVIAKKNSGALRNYLKTHFMPLRALFGHSNNKMSEDLWSLLKSDDSIIQALSPGFEKYYFDFNSYSDLYHHVKLIFDLKEESFKTMIVYIDQQSDLMHRFINIFQESRGYQLNDELIEKKMILCEFVSAYKDRYLSWNKIRDRDLYITSFIEFGIQPLIEIHYPEIFSETVKKFKPITLSIIKEKETETTFQKLMIVAEQKYYEEELTKDLNKLLEISQENAMDKKDPIDACILFMISAIETEKNPERKGLSLAEVAFERPAIFQWITKNLGHHRLTQLIAANPKTAFQLPENFTITLDPDDLPTAEVLKNFLVHAKNGLTLEIPAHLKSESLANLQKLLKSFEGGSNYKNIKFGVRNNPLFVATSSLWNQELTADKSINFNNKTYFIHKPLLDQFKLLPKLEKETLSLSELEFAYKGVISLDEASSVCHVLNEANYNPLVVGIGSQLGKDLHDDKTGFYDYQILINDSESGQEKIFNVHKSLLACYGQETYFAGDFRMNKEELLLDINKLEILIPITPHTVSTLLKVIYTNDAYFLTNESVITLIELLHLTNALLLPDIFKLSIEEVIIYSQSVAFQGIEGASKEELEKLSKLVKGVSERVWYYLNNIIYNKFIKK